MKKVIITATVLILSIILGACSVDNSNTLELALWGTPDELKIVKRSLKDFTDKYPDWKVKLTHLPPGGPYIDKLLTRSAAGNLPDVMFLEVNFIDKFIEKGMALDVTEMIANDKDFSVDDYFPTIMNRFVVDGRTYGLPRDVAPFACIYYNKNLFDQAGVPYPEDNWNLNQFLDTARKLTKIDEANPNNTQYGFHSWIWVNFLYAYGGTMVDDPINPSRCTINSREGQAGLQFLYDLRYKYNVMPRPGTMEVGMDELFRTGKIAMYLSGIWETPSFRPIKSFDWDVAMFPKGPNGKRGFATGGSGYAISSQTKNKEMAWEFLKVISGEYGQIQNARKGLAQPALKKLAMGDVWAKDIKQKPMNKGMLNEAVNHIIYNPQISEWSEIESEIIWQRIDLLQHDKITVEEALAQIENEANAFLADLKDNK